MIGTSAMAAPEQRAVPEPSAAPLPASPPGTSPQPSTGLSALQTGAGNAALAAAATNGSPPPYGDALSLQSTYGNAAVARVLPQPQAAAQPAPGVATTPALIVEDTVEAPGPGQMKKSDFLAELQTAVCQTAAEALAGTPWSESGCPYIEHWFGYYRDQDAWHVERAARKYAPETTSATSARDYIPIICARMRGPIEVWAKTGQITGVPEGLSMPLPNAPTAGSTPTSDTVAGTTTASANASPILPKALDGGAREASDPQAIQTQLGAGRLLEAGVQSRMGAAFGQDFSHVRLHTDATAGRLSSDLNARAFTVGEHIAFASSEYRPGTPVGDALIAHELAHVVQQGPAGHSNVPMLKGESDYNALEEDADISAVGVIASLWTGVKGKLSEVGKNAAPRLRSGLKLQRCTIEEAPTDLKTAEAKAKWIAQAMKDDYLLASREIVKMFQSSATLNEFLDIQKRLDMAAVIDYLEAWDAIQIGAIGPVIAGAEKLNEIRADYIVDAVNDYSLPNAMVFTLFMFNTMYTDDMRSVLKNLATNKRMGSTILHMDPVLAIIKERGLNIDDYKDPGESAYYFGRGVVSSLKNFLNSSEAAKSKVSMRYYGEKSTLPPEYQKALGKIEKAQFEEAMSPGNVIFGTIDYISFGIPGSVYGLARGTVGGVIDLAKGDYEAAGGELTGAMLLTLTYLGVKVVAKIRAPAGPGGALMGPEGPGQFVLEQPKGVPKAVSRLNTIVQLGADGEVAATALINRLGENGVLEVGRYIRADSKAARFVYENGVAGAEALQKAKGNLAEAGKLLPNIPKLQLPPPTAVPEPPPAPKTVPPAAPPLVPEKIPQQIAAEKAAAEKAATTSKKPPIIDRTTSDTYNVVDPTNSKFYAWAKVENGALIIDLRAELEGGARSTVISGAEQFQKILDHFKGQYTGIKGNWSYGTNLAKFNELTGQGMASEKAALKTWTGDQASQAGFTKAKVDSLEGTPGQYTKVKVTFTKE